MSLVCGLDGRRRKWLIQVRRKNKYVQQIYTALAVGLAKDEGNFGVEGI